MDGIFGSHKILLCAKKTYVIEIKLHFWRPDRDLNPGRSLDRAA